MRRRWAQIGCAIIVIALLVTIGGALWTYCREQQEKRAFRPEAAIELGRLAGHLVLQEPGGQVYITRPDGSKRKDLFTGGVPADFALSPDGAHLAYVDSGGRLGVFHLATLQSEVIREAPAISGVRMSWSPDGSRLAYACGCVLSDVDRNLHVLCVESGEDFVVASPSRSPDLHYLGGGQALCTVHAIHWSGDGKTLFYVMTTAFPKYLIGTPSDCEDPAVFAQAVEPSGQPRGSAERVFDDVSALDIRATSDGFSWREMRKEEGAPEEARKVDVMCAYSVEKGEVSPLTIGKDKLVLWAELSPTDPRTLWCSGTDGLYLVDEKGLKVVDEYWQAKAFRAFWSPDGQHLLVERCLEAMDAGCEYYVVSLEALGSRLRLDLPSGVRVLGWLPEIP